MRFHQLDLNLLVALDTLLTERNITVAGQKLHLSQSGMSSGLARLREYFEYELLVMVGKKMIPTPLGERLAVPVRKILTDIQATIDAKPGFHPETSTRRFTLMMSDYAATVLMTEAARRAAVSAPGIGFELLSNNVPAPVEYLDRAEVDLLVMPEDVVPGSHPKDRLFEDDYVCIVWSSTAPRRIWRRRGSTRLVSLPEKAFVAGLREFLRRGRERGIPAPGIGSRQAHAAFQEIHGGLVAHAAARVHEISLSVS